MRRAAVTHPQLSGSSCTQQGTSVPTENHLCSTVHHVASPQGKGSKREGRKRSRAKGLILQMADHRFATEHTNQPWHTKHLRMQTPVRLEEILAGFRLTDLYKLSNPHQVMVVTSQPGTKAGLFCIVTPVYTSHS